MSGTATSNLNQFKVSTSLVGREKEIADLQDALARERLVMLAGPGGMGKTRLALELADTIASRFADGVFFVDLAVLDKGTRVAPAVSTYLNITDGTNRADDDRVISHLRTKNALVIMDNCEHVLIDVGNLVARIMRDCPAVTVLATSREPLGIAGEQVFIVPPLALPADGDVESAEAVRLFVERARSRGTPFAICESNRSAVGELCRRLDGMPLAIELAATKMRTLSAGQLLERLDTRFTLLSSGDRSACARQQTLSALIEWSYELCTPAEKTLWQRLAVFRDTFDLTAVEEVCGYGDLSNENVCNLLDSLVAKSVVTAQSTGTSMRYHLLVTIREYGLQQLGTGDCWNEARTRHRDHYLNKAVVAAEQWCSPRQVAYLEDIRLERPEHMAALEWSLSSPGQASAGARHCAALRYHWTADGFLSDGRRWLERSLANDSLDPADRGAALWVLSWVLLLQGEHSTARSHLTECTSLAATTGDEHLAAYAAHWSALHSLFTGDLDAAIAGYEQAMRGYQLFDDTAGHLTAQFQLAMATVFHSQPRRALEICADGIATARAHGERWTYAYFYWISGIGHWMLGDMDQARHEGREAMEVQRDFRDLICIALVTELLGWVEGAAGHRRKWEQLGHVAESVWSAQGTTIAAFGPHINAVSTKAFADLDRIGATSVSEMLAAKEVLAITSADDHEPGPHTGTAPLSARQFEVAGHVARGLTNKEIAALLCLSQRTVDGHMERIMTALGVRSRVNVANWYAERAEAVKVS